jgi:hypothetical protein
MPNEQRQTNLHHVQEMQHGEVEMGKICCLADWKDEGFLQL